MMEMHENHKYIESLFFVQVKDMTRRKPSTYDFTKPLFGGTAKHGFACLWG